jgi:hypothetical protein
MTQVAWDRIHDFLHKNKLPYICSMHDTGFNVLSMKINYLVPFRHKHKHHKLAHENKLPYIPSKMKLAYDN